MALQQCVDCHQQLSPTAKTCNKCNSTDPFGRARAEQKAKDRVTWFGLGLAVCVAVAFYFGFIDISTIKNFLPGHR